MTSNVPGVTYGPTGFVAPAETAILAGVLADINEAFGNSLNMALSTPQGQLGSSQAAIIGDADATFVLYANLVDPAFSYGRMQDAIGRIYFITRNPALPTTVAVLCTGLANTVIPAGAPIIDESNNIYTATDGGVIGVGGSITLNFQCVALGPIACPAGTLNRIYQAIPGWDTVDNAADGVLGRNVETRSEFETRRQQSVAKNARGTIQAVQGAVLSVDGVLDAFSYQNDTGGTITYRGASIAAHSIYVAAVGGTDAAVAQAIWSKK